MKISLYNAISIDGFLARSSGDTEWVTDTDWDEFVTTIRQHEAIVMGRKTYDIAHKEDWYPIEEIPSYILTSQKLPYSGYFKSDHIHTGNVDSLMKELEEQNISSALVIGGGTINASFLKAKLIDTVIVDIHPIILGNGIRLFNGDEFNIQLEKKEVKELDEGLVKITYSVLR